MSAEDTSTGEEKTRLLWLPDGCPPWCVETHEECDAYVDRTHWYVAGSRDLLAQDPQNFGGPDNPVHFPVHLVVMLWQHYREVEPRLILSDSTDKWSNYLSLDEAEWLAETLNSLVRAARNDAPLAA